MVKVFSRVLTKFLSCKRRVFFTTCFLIVLFMNTSFVFAQSGDIQFIFTSDPHYGLKKSSFQNATAVDAHIVNTALVVKINQLPALSFPYDGGINAGEIIGAFDFIVESGDIGNRQEGSGMQAIQESSVSWNQFEVDYINGLQIPDRNNQKTPIFIIPGNHDVSNAIGFYREMTPPRDATVMVEIYNRMMLPQTLLTNDTYDYSLHRIHYSKDIGGIHFVFITLWPDSSERAWMKKDLKNIPKSVPVIMFAHDPPAVEAKHFINPNGDHSINAIDMFENLLIDQLAEGTTINDSTLKEQEDFAAFLKKHKNITAYFHGHANWNQFYEWTVPGSKTVLHAFRADSPMKGAASSADETKLSFQVVTIDTVTRMMTVRECLWNPDPLYNSASVNWGGSVTIALFPRMEIQE